MANGYNSRYKKPRDLRQLRGLHTTDAEYVKAQRLKALRKAVEFANSHELTDEEWQKLLDGLSKIN